MSFLRRQESTIYTYLLSDSLVYNFSWVRNIFFFLHAFLKWKIDLLRMWKIFFFYGIISSFWPRIAPHNSPSSFSNSHKHSLFFDSLFHIVTATGNMFTVRRFLHRLCPKRVVRREEALVEGEEGENEGFHGGKRIVCLFSIVSFGYYFAICLKYSYLISSTF